MKVRLEMMELSGSGGEFFLEMEHIPRKGEEIWVHESLLPRYYFDSDVFIEQPMDSFLAPHYGFKADWIEYMFDEEGQHVVISISEAK